MNHWNAPLRLAREMVPKITRKGLNELIVEVPTGRVAGPATPPDPDMVKMNAYFELQPEPNEGDGGLTTENPMPNGGHDNRDVASDGEVGGGEEFKGRAGNGAGGG